jgi:hypothetical protein
MATWKIVQLDRKTADGFVNGTLETATDGDFSASSYGTCGFDGELTTPYADLTEAQVLEWVWALLIRRQQRLVLRLAVSAGVAVMWKKYA